MNRAVEAVWPDLTKLSYYIAQIEQTIWSHCFEVNDWINSNWSKKTILAPNFLDSLPPEQRPLRWARAWWTSVLRRCLRRPRWWRRPRCQWTAQGPLYPWHGRGERTVPMGELVTCFCKDIFVPMCLCFSKKIRHVIAIRRLLHKTFFFII